MKSLAIILALFAGMFAVEAAQACDAQAFSAYCQPQQQFVQQQQFQSYAAPIVLRQQVQYRQPQFIIQRQNFGHHHQQNIVLQQQAFRQRNVTITNRRTLFGGNVQTIRTR